MQTATGQRHHAARSFSTLIEMLRQSADLYGDYPAFLFRNHPGDKEQTRSYRAFLSDVDAVGTALLALPLQQRRMAILGDNGYGWALAFHAVINGAGVVVPLDKQLPDLEVVRLVERGRVDVLFFGRQQRSVARTVLERCPQVQYAICLHEADGSAPGHLPDADTGAAASSPRAALTLNDLIRQGRQRLAEGDRAYTGAELDTHALASLLYTSGTTAQPKGVMLSHENLCSNIQSISGILPIRPGEKLLSILPMHHTFENTAGLNYLLYCGGCICFNDGLRYFMKNMQEWQIEVMIAVPLLFENVYRKMRENLAASGKDLLVRVLRPPARVLCYGGIDLRRRLFGRILAAMGGHLRLVVVGAAAIDPEITRTFNDFGIDFFLGYGLTEASPVISCCHQNNHVIGSVGPPLPEIEVAIDTDSDQPGAVGEILTRSRSVMLGYEDNPEETAAILTPDGWLRTGDMGYLDKTGSLHITGRIKSMIVLTNGKKAFPEEIEALLMQIGGVASAMVWGDEPAPDTVDICALLQINRDLLPEELTGQPEDAIGSWLSEKIKAVNHTMPVYKSIRWFLYTDGDMVLTTTMKIRRQPQLDQIRRWLNENNLTMRQASGRLMLS